MICELCGKQAEKGFKVRLEGSTVNSCYNCSKHGEIIERVQKKKPKQKGEQKKESKPQKIGIDVEDDYVDDFHIKIKNAREKKGLKQEDLGKLVNEPASLIHRIEGGKYDPNPQAMKKIGKALKIKLVRKHSKEDNQDYTTSKKQELTLGDMIIVRKRNQKK